VSCSYLCHSDLQTCHTPTWTYPDTVTVWVKPIHSIYFREGERRKKSCLVYQRSELFTHLFLPVFSQRGITVGGNAEQIANGVYSLSGDPGINPPLSPPALDPETVWDGLGRLCLHTPGLTAQPPHGPSPRINVLSV
jgi:hypothetical protein